MVGPRRALGPKLGEQHSRRASRVLPDRNRDADRRRHGQPAPGVAEVGGEHEWRAPPGADRPAGFGERRRALIRPRASAPRPMS